MDGEAGEPQPRPTLGQIVAYLKYDSTKRYNALRETPGAKLWQRNYYDHIIRDSHELEHARRYIRENPASWDEDPGNPSPGA